MGSVGLTGRVGVVSRNAGSRWLFRYLRVVPARPESGKLSVLGLGSGRCGTRRKVEASIPAYQNLAMGFAEYMLTDLAGVQQIDGGSVDSAPGWEKRGPAAVRDFVKRLSPAAAAP
jgi:hypothetical protein